MQLHVISNGRLSLQQFAEKMHRIASYVDYIHVREKQKTARELFNGINYLRHKGVNANQIVVNDRIDVASVCEVSGVQLAYHSLTADVVKRQFPQLRVGCSVHSVEEARAAQEAGADYVLFGHVYATASKPGLSPRGVDSLQEVTQAIQIPVIALGGIKPQASQLEQLANAGASGIAVMSGIVDATDPVMAVQGYVNAIQAIGGGT